MEERGWTAALFFPVSFQLERNAQSEYQERLMVPACCHLIVFMSAFHRYFVFPLGVSCHFVPLSVRLLHFSGHGLSVGIKEIKGYNTYFFFLTLQISLAVGSLHHWQANSDTNKEET